MNPWYFAVILCLHTHNKRRLADPLDRNEMTFSYLTHWGMFAPVNYEMGILYKIMAWGLYGDIALSEPMLTYCQLDS